MALKTRKFDMARFLETDQDIATYLSEALETGDAAYVAHAFGAVARSRGMAKVARRAGLGRESLYKALSASGNPELATVLRVAKAIGIDLTAKPAATRRGRAKVAKPRIAKPKGGKRVPAARRAA
jgi:probable addiction module antidote protein